MFNPITNQLCIFKQVDFLEKVLFNSSSSNSSCSWSLGIVLIDIIWITK